MHTLEIRTSDGQLHYLNDLFLVEVSQHLKRNGYFEWTDTNENYQKTIRIYERHIISMEETFYKGESE